MNVVTSSSLHNVIMPTPEISQDRQTRLRPSHGKPVPGQRRPCRPLAAWPSTPRAGSLPRPPASPVPPCVSLDPTPRPLQRLLREALPSRLPPPTLTECPHRLTFVHGSICAFVLVLPRDSTARPGQGQSHQGLIRHLREWA